MNEQLEEEFDKAFGKFKDHPAYDSLLAEYVEFRNDNPDGIKLSDMAIARLFPSIDWNDGKELQVLLKCLMKLKEDNLKRYEKAVNESGKKEVEFVYELIADVARYKAIAMMLEVKLGLIKHPPEFARDMIRLV